jgi:tRNA A58 N-methylase Trm61
VTSLIRRGPFEVGDQVQITDPKGRKHTVVLTLGKQFHTHQGALEHDELIGQPEGVVVTSTGGTPYLAFRPLLSDFVLSMPRGAAVVYPKDAAMIVGYADVFPGAHVIEAGAGSGALSCSLLRAVGETGLVYSYERREDFAAVAVKNVERFFGSPHPAWRLTVGDLVESLADHPPTTPVDRVVLDMLSPWECVDAIARVLLPRRPDLLLRRHYAAAVAGRRVAARRRPVRRTGFLGDDAAHLACRGSGRAPRPPHDRPHRVPGHRPPTRRRGGRSTAAPSAHHHRFDCCRPAKRPGRGLELGVRPGNLNAVAHPDDVDARTWTLSGRFDHLVERVRRDVGLRGRVGQQVTGGVLHVRQAVDVELEDVARLLNTDPVTCAQVLVDPHPVPEVRGPDVRSGRLCGHDGPPPGLRTTVLLPGLELSGPRHNRR